MASALRIAKNETTGATLPRCYTVQEIAEALRFSEETIRAMFQDRPGVVRITKGKRLRGKREYVTLRIPESVFNDFLLERTR